MIIEKLKVLLILAILTIWIQACSSRTVETITVGGEPTTPPSPNEVEESLQPISGDVLRLGEVNKIINFDPLFASNAATQRIIQLVYEGLVSLNEEGQIIPAISKRWQVSSDSLTYTFHLNRNIYFQDDASFSSGIGRRIKASDFKRSFERMASRDVPPNAAELFLDYIAGFEAYFFEQREVYQADERTLSEINGIKAVNDSTLTISLIERDSDLLVKLASPYAGVYPHEALRFRQSGLRNHPIGTGAFQFESSQGDTLHVLERNPGYHNTLVRPDRIEILSVNDEQTIFNQFVRGNLDAIMELGPQMIRNVVNENNEIVPAYRDQYELVTINHYEPYIVRYNPDNRYGINQGHAATLANMINIDTIKARLEDPSLELTYQTEESNGEYLDDLRRRFSERRENRRLILAAQPELYAQVLGAQIVGVYNQEVNAGLMNRRLFNRDIFLFLDQITRFTTNEQIEPMPQEILRFQHDRYFLMHNDLQNVRFNSFSWWINLTNAQLSDNSR
ncbi:MAG: ABC transporter substrate-binding protein [Balneolales bacterium]